MMLHSLNKDHIISLLNSDDITSLAVTVIFHNADSVIKWKGANKGKLAQNVLNILYNQLVNTDGVIEIHHPLGQILGIHSVLINSCSNYGLVTKSTFISVDNITSLLRFKQTQSAPTRLGGLNSVIDMLTDLVLLSTKHRNQFKDNGLEPPHGILLQGPPGCGKTSVLKQVAFDVGALILVINGPELLGSRAGETQENLNDIFSKAEDHAKEGICILFLDEIDAMCGSSEKAEDARIVSHLCTLLDKIEDVIIIGATNRPNAVHKSLRRPGRMDREVFIGIPNVTEREQILRALTKDMPLAEDVRLSDIAEATRAYVGADLAQLCQETAYSSLNDKRAQISMADFQRTLHIIRPSAVRNSQARVDLRPLQWNEIAGLERVKTKIKQAVEWPILHPEAFKRLGLEPPRGVLLYGPPGCAKTSLVRAAATSCKATFLAVTGAQIYSPYVGDSEKIVAQIFHEARVMAPSILFLDELDSIVGTRSASQAGVQERVLSTLLNLIDGVGVKLSERTVTEKVKENEQVDSEYLERTVSPESSSVPHVLIVGATNRPDLIDDALLRPGRMDRIIYVPPPDEETRHNILSLRTSRMPLCDDVDLKKLAEITNHFTGADLESLCNEAGLLALTLSDFQCRKITMEHFQLALSKMTPSLTVERIQEYSNCLRIG